MRFWFFSAGSKHDRRRQRPAPTVRPFLESLEDRCVPSATSTSAGTSPAPVNTVAALSHDQIHAIQDQSQQQTANATILLEVEQVVLGILQPFAAQVPQIQPDIALLTSVIPGQQARVNTLQNQTNLLNQLDNLQDTVIIDTAQIQQANGLIPTFQQQGNTQEVNALQSIIAADQAQIQAVQPQINAVEVEVSTFV
jgi:hypothetical protein